MATLNCKAETHGYFTAISRLFHGYFTEVSNDFWFNAFTLSRQNEIKTPVSFTQILTKSYSSSKN